MQKNKVIEEQRKRSISNNRKNKVMENQLTATIVHLEKGQLVPTENQSFMNYMNTSRLNFTRLEAGSLSNSV